MKRQHYSTDGPGWAIIRIGKRRVKIDLRRVARENCLSLDDLTASAEALDRDRSAAA